MNDDDQYATDEHYQACCKALHEMLGAEQRATDALAESQAAQHNLAMMLGSGEFLLDGYRVLSDASRDPDVPYGRCSAELMKIPRAPRPEPIPY